VQSTLTRLIGDLRVLIMQQLRL